MGREGGVKNRRKLKYVFWVWPLRASAIDTDVTVTRRAARGYVRTKSYRAAISTELPFATTSKKFRLRRATE